ncbi:alpha-amylase family glycosyl hydrolase [Flaviflexus huanghaiensis]|uniref:alpha-amylase family glycosyl hydrolase n=1 Tax=Flaviflexus huanghaiensis TaxID=1111473 RepID=UPI0015FB66D8|nr:alpha-amylase family glycosyl hydrolase [Flaviflexus huanghaiensis]
MNILWQVYPLGATAAPIRDWSDPETGEHRLQRLMPWLDHAAGLSDALLLGPIFTSVTHGYDTLDHRTIDPRLGTEADFDDLVAAAGELGMGIVLDGVFNHVAKGHALDDHVARNADGSPRLFEGHGSLLELDHSDPAVIDYIIDTLLHWLERGATGWRMDAAYRMDPSVWEQIVPPVKEAFPDAWFLGEVIHGDYPRFTGPDRLDSVTQYELWKAIWSSLKDENFFELEWTLQRHSQLLESFTPNTFIGNHDVERITSTLGRRRAAMAAVLLFTLPGIPSVYAGDEFGWLGTKADGFAADDPLRPELPAHPSDAIDPSSSQILNVYRWGTNLRREHEWLQTAQMETANLSNTTMTYRVTGAERELAVSLDLTTESAAVSLDGVPIWHLPDIDD